MSRQDRGEGSLRWTPSPLGRRGGAPIHLSVGIAIGPRRRRRGIGGGWSRGGLSLPAPRPHHRRHRWHHPVHGRGHLVHGLHHLVHGGRHLLHGGHHASHGIPGPHLRPPRRHRVSVTPGRGRQGTSRSAAGHHLARGRHHPIHGSGHLPHGGHHLLHRTTGPRVVSRPWRCPHDGRACGHGGCAVGSGARLGGIAVGTSLGEDRRRPNQSQQDPSACVSCLHGACVCVGPSSRYPCQRKGVMMDSGRVNLLMSTAMRAMFASMRAMAWFIRYMDWFMVAMD